jgi:hypothetical protein
VTDAVAAIPTRIAPLTDAIATVRILPAPMKDAIEAVPETITPFTDLIAVLPQLVAAGSDATLAAVQYVLVAGSASLTELQSAIRAYYEVPATGRTVKRPHVPVAVKLPSTAPLDVQPAQPAHNPVTRPHVRSTDGVAALMGFQKSLSSELPQPHTATAAPTGPSSLSAPLQVARVVGGIVVAASLWALLLSALPGVGGLTIFTSAGVRFGYRQAKAGAGLQVGDIARFARPGPLGIVRSGAVVKRHRTTSGAHRRFERFDRAA